MYARFGGNLNYGSRSGVYTCYLISNVLYSPWDIGSTLVEDIMHDLVDHLGIL